MKLIVAGATGLVGREIVRQSLQHAKVTKVVALSRGKLELDEPIDSDKLKCVRVKDYGEYPAEALAEFAGADACIWTVAVTPFKMGAFEFDEVKRVCQDCTFAGFKAVMAALPQKPFRFLYFSAEGTPREADAQITTWREYQLMRGETERMVLALPAQYPGVEVCIAQPGVVTGSGTWVRRVLGFLFAIVNVFTRSIPNINRKELAAAAVDQAVVGFEKETLLNNDLVRIGRS